MITATAEEATSKSVDLFARNRPRFELVFGPVFDWPTIPLHMGLLPNGKVLGFGAHPTANEGTEHYAVWNPANGATADAVTELANTTGNNIFCAGQTLLPAVTLRAR